MDNILIKLLRLKHWKLFLLILIPSSFSAPYGIGYIFNMFGGLVFGLHLYAIVKFGAKALPPKAQRFIDPKKVSLYGKISIGLLAIFFVTFAILGDDIDQIENNLFIEIPISILLLALFYFGFVIISQASKTIVMLETNKKAKGEKLYLTLFLVLFYYIGIWINQPKINKWFSNENYL